MSLPKEAACRQCRREKEKLFLKGQKCFSDKCAIEKKPYAPGQRAKRRVMETEYFKEERLQISIFMSPVNVHVTRYPASGVIKYSKYHPGKYLVAWHPKSSEENERTTVVIRTPKFGDILYRQIAGAMARRIVNYAEEGESVQQGEESGFIKFGSRVDVFLPLNAMVAVKLNQKVKGAVTCLASLNTYDEEG